MKNANIVTERNTAKRVAFLLKFDVTKDFCGFFYGFWFVVMASLVVMALWFLDALFGFLSLPFSTSKCCVTCHDPRGVIIQKSKWLIDRELEGYNVALVGAW